MDGADVAETPAVRRFPILLLLREDDNNNDDGDDDDDETAFRELMMKKKLFVESRPCSNYLLTFTYLLAYLLDEYD
jgi:hypothetical protein